MAIYGSLKYTVLTIFSHIPRRKLIYKIFLSGYILDLKLVMIKMFRFHTISKIEVPGKSIFMYNIYFKKSLHVSIITPLNLSQIIDVNMEGNNVDDAS